MSSYSRACKYCGRRINLRQMPHGQWVPFEGDQQHVCDEPAQKKAVAPIKPRTPSPAEPPAPPFKPLYPEVPEDPPPNPQPAPPRPVSPPPHPAPTKRRGFVETFLGVITGLLGSTFGLMVSAFALLSLPLNVIAAMHIFGWSWFGALVGVILFSCIPYIGQLGFLILAVMGAYYVWDTNFDWQKAAYPPTKTFSIATLSEAELERFKTEVVRPGFEKACKAEALKTAGFDGKLPARAASQCECFATNFATRLTRADMIAFEKTGQYPDDMQQRVGSEIRRACQN